MDKNWNWKTNMAQYWTETREVEPVNRARSLAGTWAPWTDAVRIPVGNENRIICSNKDLWLLTTRMSINRLIQHCQTNRVEFMNWSVQFHHLMRPIGMTDKASLSCRCMIGTLGWSLRGLHSPIFSQIPCSMPCRDLPITSGLTTDLVIYKTL